MERSAENDLRSLAELGRLLSAATGYEIRRSDGKRLGSLDHVRYEARADYPDELIVRRRGPWPRSFIIPFRAVAAIDPRAQTITLRPAS